MCLHVSISSSRVIEEFVVQGAAMMAEEAVEGVLMLRVRISRMATSSCDGLSDVGARA